MLEDLLGHGAIATADDEHMADGTVRQDRDVPEHLVVHVLVGRRQLGDAVEHHERPEPNALGDSAYLAQHIDYQVLALRSAVKQRSPDFDRRAVAVVQGLRVPETAVGIKLGKIRPRHVVLRPAPGR